VPPLTGVAVNVTMVPAQMVFCDAAILIDGITSGVTFIVMLLLVAVAGTAQAELLVIIQLTTSPLTSVLLLNVGLFVPALAPFSNHW
jgi:hypothetical protein